MVIEAQRVTVSDTSVMIEFILAAQVVLLPLNEPVLNVISLFVNGYQALPCSALVYELQLLSHSTL